MSEIGPFYHFPTHRELGHTAFIDKILLSAGQYHLGNVIRASEIKVEDAQEQTGVKIKILREFLVNFSTKRQSIGSRMSHRFY